MHHAAPVLDLGAIVMLVGISALYMLPAIIALALYLLTTIIAFRRNHPNRWPILIINAVAGLTVLGWFLTLAWALKALHLSDSGSDGGESGLNLFVNDEKRVRVVRRREERIEPHF
jgi:hypothetical protein